MTRFSRSLRDMAPPTIAVALLVLAWWIATDVFRVPGYLLPRPSRVVRALWASVEGGILWGHLLATCKTWLTGFCLGSLVAFCISISISEFKSVERLLMPLILALQSVPKIALAPLVFVWIGFGQPAIVTMAALTTYFPVLINSLAGLRSYDRDLEALYCSFNAPRLLLLFDVKLPSAARQTFAGLEIGLLFALIGNVVMEFIVGTEGLGYLIQESANAADLPLNFAAILALAACGMTLSYLLRALRTRVIYWDRHAETERAAT